jgi:hypothetical protein
MKLFNDKNSAMPISFDQILNSRHFNSVYKEENVYGDREIKDYMKDNASESLLESERVKEKLKLRIRYVELLVCYSKTLLNGKSFLFYKTTFVF